MTFAAPPDCPQPTIRHYDIGRICGEPVQCVVFDGRQQCEWYSENKTRNVGPTYNFKPCNLKAREMLIQLEAENPHRVLSWAGRLFMLRQEHAEELWTPGLEG